MEPLKSFMVTSQAVSASGVKSSGEIVSPEPPPGIELTVEERKAYDYLCKQLRAAGVDHVTAGMALAMLTRKWFNWNKAEKECEAKGRVQISKTGWATPTPWADDEKRLSMEVGQWLAKVCMTCPSLARVRKDTGGGGGQDDLFSDLVNHATGSPGKSYSN